MFWKRHKVTMVEAGLEDLSSLAGMDQQQLKVIESHVTKAYERGDASARAEVDSWSSRISHLLTSFFIIGVTTGIAGAGAGLLVWLSAPQPQRVEVEVLPPSPAGDRWALHHKSLDGRFIWVREPVDGVQCFRLSNRPTDPEIYEANLGCVATCPTLPNPELFGEVP